MPILYVDSTHGDNANALPERLDRPFRSIAAAVAKAQSGDVILYLPGSDDPTPLPAGVSKLQFGRWLPEVAAPVQFLPGNWLGPAYNRSAIALGAGALVLCPILVPRACLLTDIACEVTGGVASTFVRMGAWADRGDGYPGALLSGADTGQIDASSAGVKSHTYATPIPLQAGRLWIGAVNQGGTPTVASNTAPGKDLFASAAAGYLQNTQLVGYLQSGVNGALPSTFTSTIGATTSAHRVCVKLAAAA